MADTYEPAIARIYLSAFDTIWPACEIEPELAGTAVQLLSPPRTESGACRRFPSRTLLPQAGGI